MPVLGLFDNPEQERQLLVEGQMRRERMAAMRRGSRPEDAVLASELGKAFPFLEPGVVLAATKAKLTPEQTYDIAALDLQTRRQREGLGIHEPGQPVTAAEIRAEEEEKRAQGLGVGERLTGMAKGAVRGLLTGVAAPFEEVERGIKASAEAALDDDPDYFQSLGENWNALPQSNLGQAVSDFSRGESVSAGSGWFSGGAIATARDEASRQLQLAGAPVTPGRATALWGTRLFHGRQEGDRIAERAISEPGRSAFDYASTLVDLGTQVFADPATYVGGGIAHAKLAAKAFGQVDTAGRVAQLGRKYGLIDAHRPTVAIDVIDDYLTRTKPGQLAVKAIADTDDFEALRSLFPRMKRESLLTLADETDPALIRETLSGELRESLTRPTAVGPLAGASRMIGQGIGSVAEHFGAEGASAQGRAFGARVAVKRSLERTRWAGAMPGQKVAIDSIDDGLPSFVNSLKNVKLANDRVSHYSRQFAELDDGDHAGAYDVISSAFTEAAGRIKGKGIEPYRAEKATEIVEHFDELKKFRHYFVADGKNVPVLGAEITIDGSTTIVDAKIQLIVEAMNRAVPLPDPRELRRLTSAAPLRKLLDSKAGRFVTSAGERVTSDVVKPLQILRGAYILRVVGEEQARIATAGYSSMTRHPLSYISWALGDGRISALIKQTGLDEQAIDAMGNDWSLVHEWAGIQVSKRGVQKWRTGLAGREQWSIIPRKDPNFAGSWARELQELIMDPVARRLAGGMQQGDTYNPALIGREALRDWLRNGSGRKDLERVMRFSDDHKKLLTDDAVMDKYLDDIEWRIYEKSGGFKTDPAQIAQLRALSGKTGPIPRFTGGSDELRQVIATGRWTPKVKGARELDLRGGDVSSGRYKHWMRELESLKSTDAAPASVKHQTMLGSLGNPVTEWRQTADDVINTISHMIIAQPTNKLSRIPVFKQAYWQKMQGLMSEMDQATQHALVTAAERANVERGLVDAMRGLANDPKFVGAGTLVKNLADADVVAKSAAMKGTNDLLYQMTERSQLADILRIVVPYMDAYKETLATWSRLPMENPRSVRTFQKIVEAARGNDQDPRSGIFWSDDQGNEMFSYPGAGLVSKALGLGDKAEAGFAASATGLNMFSSTLMPGLGALVTIPAHMIFKALPKEEGLDPIKEMIFPYGEPDLSSGIVRAFTPSWLQKVMVGLRGDEGARLFGNSMADVMRALELSGEYSTATPEDQERLLKAAQGSARKLWIIRGIAQFVAPSAPQVQWTYEDVKGEAWKYQDLADEYRRIVEATGSTDAAAQVMLSRFGPGFGLLIQSKTEELKLRPVTPEGVAWEKSNADLFRDFGAVAGLFAPQDAEGEFDYAAYVRQIQDGDREQLTPKEMLQLSNQFLGRTALENARRMAARLPGERRELFLQQARAKLQEAYPGFDSYIPVPGKPGHEEQIRQIAEIVKDSRIANTPEGRAVARYLEMREIATFAAERMKLKSFSRSQKALDIRSALRAEAGKLAQETPGFAVIFDRVFEPELRMARDDLAELASAA